MYDCPSYEIDRRFVDYEEICYEHELTFYEDIHYSGTR